MEEPIRINKPGKDTRKRCYLKPEMEVIGLETEGLIAMSPTGGIPGVDDQKDPEVQQKTFPWWE